MRSLIKFKLHNVIVISSIDKANTYEYLARESKGIRFKSYAQAKMQLIIALYTKTSKTKQF